MKLDEVLLQYDDTKKIKRKSWDNYTFELSFINRIYAIYKEFPDLAIHWKDDLNADDWEITE